MFWLIVLVIVVVGFGLAWWTSGRQQRGIDDQKVQLQRKKDEGKGSMF